MSDFNFNIITEEDKEQMSYVACVGGATITGMAVGRFVGVQGVLIGAAAGAAYGLLTCRRLAPAIKRKLFSRGDKLSDHELAQVLQAVKEQSDVRTKSEAMNLLAAAREEILKNPAKYR